MISKPPRSRPPRATLIQSRIMGARNLTSRVPGATIAQCSWSGSARVIGSGRGVKVAVGRRERPQGARDQAGEVVHGDRSQQPLPAAEKDRDAAWTCRGKLSVKYVGRKKVNGTPLKRR
jgi:hypothetical protein